MPILLLIVLIGLLVRLRNLGTLPFWVDEAFHALAAKNFLLGNGFSLPGAPYTRAWLTTTLPIAVSFSVLGYTEFAARLPSAFIGTATIGAVYLLGKEFANADIGLLAALFVALDPLSIAWAREARMYAHLQLLYLVAVFWLSRWYRVELTLRSRFIIPGAIILVFGYLTHTIFLSFGLVFFTFLLIPTIVRYTLRSDRHPGLSERAFRNSVIILVALLVGGAIMLAVRGIPPELLQTRPEAWPGRGTQYYLVLLWSQYHVLTILFLVGAYYLMRRGERGYLLLLAFILPLVLASFTDRKADRYILHLIPLFAVIAFCAFGYFHNLACSITDSWAGASLAERRSSSWLTTILATLAIVVLLASVPPASAYNLTDENADAVTYARSDHRVAAEWLSAYGREADVVVSMRPEVTLWYTGRADYFFRQRGITYDERDNGWRVHDRTNTRIVDSVRSTQEMLEREPRGWVFATNRFFHDRYVDPDTRNYLVDHTIRYDEQSWSNLDILYWGPDMYANTFEYSSWNDSFVETSGNVRVIQDEYGNQYLALGRSRGRDQTHGVFGVNTGETHGTVVLSLAGSSEYPMAMDIRAFGDDDRFVTVAVSDTGATWNRVYRSRGGWDERTVSLPAASTTETMYIRLSGGANESSLGGLIRYVKIYPQFQNQSAPNSTSLSHFEIAAHDAPSDSVDRLIRSEPGRPGWTDERSPLRGAVARSRGDSVRPRRPASSGVQVRRLAGGSSRITTSQAPSAYRSVYLQPVACRVTPCNAR